MVEPLRDYCRRKIVEHYQEEGLELPIASATPLQLPIRGAIDAWFERQDAIRNKAEAERTEAQREKLERKKAVTAAKRKVDDADRKRLKRAEMAAAEGQIIRTRTNCSKMSAEERTEHNRTMDRNKHRRQRGSSLAEPLPVPMELNPLWGRF